MLIWIPLEIEEEGGCEETREGESGESGRYMYIYSLPYLD